VHGGSALRYLALPSRPLLGAQKRKAAICGGFLKSRRTDSNRGPLHYEERRVSDTRPLTGTRGHSLLEPQPFEGDPHGHQCPPVPARGPAPTKGRQTALGGPKTLGRLLGPAGDSDASRQDGVGLADVYTRRVEGVSENRGGIGGRELDRRSFVPLYYQLQELLKEQIESGIWSPGDPLPSEPELARRFGVSRVVVRQALAILEDDRQILRVRGRGTFVAQPKLDYRAGGLSRLLINPRAENVAVQVLDKRVAAPERSIRRELAAGDDEPITRLTTLLSLEGIPLAISYSFFRRGEVGWLEAAARVGRVLPQSLVLADYGIELAQSQVSIETSQCGQFEADRFGIPHRSAVFLVLCTEFARDGDDARPFEVARVEYRGDLLQFRMEVSPTQADTLSATWSLNEQLEALAGAVP
jgi:GntR family transcriptional regulator